MNLITITALCLISWTSQDIYLSKQQQIAVLSEAQMAYDQGVALQTSDPVAARESFRRSVERFQILVNDGIENGRLWYNIGNANIQANEIGEAIAAYKAAARHIPSDGRLKANVQHARTLVRDPIQDTAATSMLKRLAFWHETLPTQFRLLLGVLAWSTCWVLISVRLFREIPGFKTATVCLGFVAVAMGISIGANIVDQHKDQGVLTASEVIVRKGNGTNYAPMFSKPLHEGVEFDIIEQRPNWLHILLPNGSKGWIHEDDAQIVSLDTDSKTNQLPRG